MLMLRSAWGCILLGRGRVPVPRLRTWPWASVSGQWSVVSAKVSSRGADSRRNHIAIVLPVWDTQEAGGLKVGATGKGMGRDGLGWQDGQERPIGVTVMQKEVEIASPHPTRD
ncbi:hypothetical protein F5883DRAFT_542543 [Diaporthe sp. PMI_573]|nr:hypothetical protein F5883DRAFT_542543 [Diaporthaceae sp. PMI_573]